MIILREEQGNMLVEGHANSGKYGEDIVCAMVSSFMWLLYKYDEENVVLEEGYSKVPITKYNVKVIDTILKVLDEIGEYDYYVIDNNLKDKVREATDMVTEYENCKEEMLKNALDIYKKVT